MPRVRRRPVRFVEEETTGGKRLGGKRLAASRAGPHKKRQRPSAAGLSALQEETEHDSARAQAYLRTAAGPSQVREAPTSSATAGTPPNTASAFERDSAAAASSGLHATQPAFSSQHLAVPGFATPSAPSVPLLAGGHLLNGPRDVQRSFYPDCEAVTNVASSESVGYVPRPTLASHLSPAASTVVPSGPSTNAVSTSTVTAGIPAGGEYGMGQGQTGLGLGIACASGGQALQQINRPEQIASLGSSSTLGAHVSQVVKEKIWKGEFVDFSLLYNDTAAAVLARSDQNTSDLTLVVEGDNLLVRKKGSNRKKIETFDTWQSAFHTFMSVYLEKHPNRCAELLKYAETIRTASLHFPGLGWRMYDEQFRLQQERDPARSWGVLDFELWLTVAAVGVTSVSAVQRGSNITLQNTGSKFKGNRPGYCFAFNNVQGCRFSDCKYAHTCSKCQRMGHGAARCKMGGLARWVNHTPNYNSRPNAVSMAAPKQQRALTNTASAKAQFAASKSSSSSQVQPHVSNSATNSGSQLSFRTTNTN